MGASNWPPSVQQGWVDPISSAATWPEDKERVAHMHMQALTPPLHAIMHTCPCFHHHITPSQNAHRPLAHEITHWHKSSGTHAIFFPPCSAALTCHRITHITLNFLFSFTMIHHNLIVCFLIHFHSVCTNTITLQPDCWRLIKTYKLLSHPSWPCSISTRIVHSFRWQCLLLWRSNWSAPTHWDVSGVVEAGGSGWINNKSAWMLSLIHAIPLWADLRR